MSDDKWFSMAGSLDGSSTGIVSAESTPEKNNPTELSVNNSTESAYIKPVKGFTENNFSSQYESKPIEPTYVKTNNIKPYSKATEVIPGEKENPSDIVEINNFDSDLPVHNTVSLSRQLTELANDIDSLESVLDQIEALKSQLQMPEPRKHVATKWSVMKGFVFGGIGALFFPSIIFLNALCGTLDENSFSSIMIFASFLACIGVALIVIGCVTSQKRMENYNSKNLNKYNAEVQKRYEMQRQYDELENSKAIIVSRIQERLINGGSTIVIPESYFYSDAIRFFAERIATGRSNSISEAMDAYDAYIHRLKLEQAAEEAAEYQRQSAENLAAISREQSAMRRQDAINTALHVANTIHHWDK